MQGWKLKTEECGWSLGYSLEKSDMALIPRSTPPARTKRGSTARPWISSSVSWNQTLFQACAKRADSVFLLEKAVLISATHFFCCTCDRIWVLITRCQGVSFYFALVFFGSSLDVALWLSVRIPMCYPDPASLANGTRRKCAAISAVNVHKMCVRTSHAARLSHMTKHSRRLSGSSWFLSSSFFSAPWIFQEMRCKHIGADKRRKASSCSFLVIGNMLIEWL